MEWFGWLTKPHLLVSGLDRLIEFGELFVLVVVGGALYFVLFEDPKNKRKRT
jgi:hypothetical protein